MLGKEKEFHSKDLHWQVAIFETYSIYKNDRDYVSALVYRMRKNNMVKKGLKK